MKHVLVLLLTIASYCAIAQDKQPVQCKGITVKGVQCSMRVKDGEYCHIHNPDTPHCNVKTSKGAPCKRIVKSTTEVCAQHVGKEKMQPVSNQ
jgi:hypothetical protein